MISFSALAPVEYKNGFRKPSTGFPDAMRRSFSSETTLAKMGLEQLVPLMSCSSPSSTIVQSTPAAATSGKPLPDALN